MPQAKEASREGTGPQDFQIQPDTIQVRRRDSAGIEKYTDVQRKRSETIQRYEWGRVEEEQSRGIEL